MTKILLKQNLIITLAIIFGWIIGYWLYHYEYFFLWFISLLIPFVFVPLAYLHYSRIKNNKSIDKLNKIYKAMSWLFVVICLLPIISSFIFEIYLLYSIGQLSPNIIRPIFNLALESILNGWPYLIVIGLLYWAIRINRQLKQV